MGKFIHRYELETEFNEERNNNYNEPWLSLTESIDRVDYNKTEEEKLLSMPFTIEALGSGNISWKLKAKSLQYSKNGGEWTTMDSATTITVVQGDEIQFKGTNSSYCGNTFSSTVQFNVKGNIMSLTSGDNFVGADSVSTNAFRGLFSGCTTVVSAKKLKLPATTLGTYCYYGMFRGCIALTTAPELPATTLTPYCYSYIFQDCTSLTTAPVLPATTLASGCCYYMFYGCTSLTTAPELPATALTESCYNSMFSGCTSLTTAPELPATTLAYSCYVNMFAGCTNLSYIKAMFTTTPGTDYTYSWVSGVAATGTFVKNAAAGWNVSGNDGIPTGWTVQTASE